MGSTPDEVADIVSPVLLKLLTQFGGPSPQIFMYPRDLRVKILGGHEPLIIEDVRFCCSHHCFIDCQDKLIEQIQKKMGSIGSIAILLAIDPPEKS